ncbi:MAG: VOC family protein [Erythrobacter sp.]|uniref:VOC family protein n=1 Tax=Erythrobacter sp. TaxID=1042 RepID=UPI002607ED47|nr:VOC family protein [Erythrobacter sp.]MDJ0977605.1 VOC family protein [Erythrobacter sp.]
MKWIGPVLAAGLLSGCVIAVDNDGNDDAPRSVSAAQPKAAGVEAPEDRLPTDVRRTTIIVRDIERSLALYRDVIGLEVNYDTTVTTSGVALPAGEPGATARLVLLNANDPWVGWIGLMEWVDPAIPADDYPTRMGPGDVVIILNTDDVEGRCEGAKSVAGVTFTAEPRLQVYPGRDGGADIRVMGCNFFDPDGILIELNQILE